MKICAQTSYQGQTYCAFTGFHLVRYETWLLHYQGNKICFKGHIGHEGGPESKIEVSKEQYSYFRLATIRMAYRQKVTPKSNNNKSR
jgi:hypothetical protein